MRQTEEIPSQVSRVRRPVTKPKLTVVVGAGASVPLGTPSTNELTTAVFSELYGHGGLSDTFRSNVARLRDVACRYYCKNGRALSFERLMDLFESAGALISGWTPNNAPTISEACLTQPYAELAEVLNGSFAGEGLFVCKSAIVDAITNASGRAQQHERWPEYHAFWAALGDVFNLTVVTLNYDTLIEQALTLTGEHQGLIRVPDENVWRLDTKRLHEVREEHMLLHLHGGIHFGGRQYDTDATRFCYEDGFHELYWHSSAESARQTMWGHSPPRSQSGRPLEGDRIITGLHKADKILIEPLASYYVEAANRLRRCERLIVLGYGFADFHVNAMLARMVRSHTSARRIVLIDQIDTMRETGSTQRADMLGMIRRWARQNFCIQDLRQDPWCSEDGAMRFYWSGLFGAAQQLPTIVKFLAP
jgi:hypothetical protein